MSQVLLVWILVLFLFFYFFAPWQFNISHILTQLSFKALNKLYLYSLFPVTLSTERYLLCRPASQIHKAVYLSRSLLCVSLQFCHRPLCSAVHVSDWSELVRLLKSRLIHRAGNIFSLIADLRLLHSAGIRLVSYYLNSWLVGGLSSQLSVSCWALCRLIISVSPWFIYLICKLRGYCL